LCPAAFQQQDQSYLLDALAQLGPNYVGVTQLMADATDQEILDLHRYGVRGVRFNLYRGGSESPKRMREFAHRIFDLTQWHIELYVDSADLKDLYPVLKSLPCLSIDHLGLTRTGYVELLKLVANGAKVKATGFGRLNFDYIPALCELYEANPTAVMFGTDLPSTRAARPFSHRDILSIQQACLDQNQLHTKEPLGDVAVNRILYENAVNFYLNRLM